MKNKRVVTEDVRATLMHPVINALHYYGCYGGPLNMWLGRIGWQMSNITEMEMSVSRVSSARFDLLPLWTRIE